ncbi:UbiD family decarboxylase domain-containing protein [Actinokineospora sp.]|uniref:UbiD family decarboxylase domain-containing protein n=1 Tax=Actinokineospora sp. TaxID=1872133 RepID=UPI0040378B66
MTSPPGLSVRAAVDRTPLTVHSRPLGCTEVGAAYADAHAGIPATSRDQSEPVVEYTVADVPLAPVLLGLYGDERRVRGWLPGYPEHVTPDAVRGVPAVAPVAGARVADRRPPDLTALPALQVTSSDAGPYLTMGLVHAEGALSVHRMLVLDETRLTVWMVPGRGLAARHERALRRGRPLPVSVNIGAPPAAVIASAVNSRFLPPGTSKLDLAGGLAGAPVTLARAGTQPVDVLAESEIVLEGELGWETADETLGEWVGGSMPEFLGYDGGGRADLPVLTVTGMTVRPGARYQAVIGPGREQSAILGLGGALSVALSASTPEWATIRDLHFAPAGGGMVLLAVAVAKSTPADDHAPSGLAREIFAAHPFVKLIVFTDPDVDIRVPEDLWWAVTTRTNLAADCVTADGHPPVPMLPSESPAWQRERPGTGRTYIDATVPFRVVAPRSLRHRTPRRNLP